MARWQTSSDLLGLMEDEDDDAELREALALSMRTYEAEHPVAQPGQAQQLPSSSPDDDTDADDELQQALALSMRTYDAEQQPAQRQQHPQQPQEPSRQLNKRIKSPAAADPAGHDARLAVAACSAGAGAEEAAPAKKPRSSSSPWKQPTATADGALLYQANPSNLGAPQQGAAAAAGTDVGFASIRQANSATTLLLASSGLLALGQAPVALQLLALQQHNLQQQQQQQLQQHNLQQQQQQPPAADGLLASCMPSPAGANPQQPTAAGAQPSLGRSGRVQDFGQLAGTGAGLAGNTTATAEHADWDLCDLGDLVDEGDDDMASRGSGGSGVAGMYAHYSAMQLSEQPGRQQHQHQHQQQQQVAQQQPQHQGLPSSGRGSSSSEVGARRLYQLREPVWYIDPLFQTCFRGCVLGAVAEQGGSSAAGVGGGISSRYIVDLQCAAVRYVEATAAQLLPRLSAGDWVWCKPSTANYNQLGAATRQRMQLLRQQNQQQQQHAGHDPWFGAEWVLGQVVSAQLQLSVPVCEVRLADGDACWFPNIHLEAVREVGESSSAAESRGVALIAAAAAMPAAEAADAAGTAAGFAELQQLPAQLSGPLQQQAEQSAGAQQQQQRTAEVPLVPSSGSRHGLYTAGSTGSVRCAAQGSCGAGAAPDIADAAGADAGTQGMETDVAAASNAAAAAAAGPDTADVAVGLTDSSRGAAAMGVACGVGAAGDEEVADSTDLLLLLPPAAEGAGDSREEPGGGDAPRQGWPC